MNVFCSIHFSHKWLDSAVNWNTKMMLLKNVFVSVKFQGNLSFLVEIENLTWYFSGLNIDRNFQSKIFWTQFCKLEEKTRAYMYSLSEALPSDGMRYKKTFVRTWALFNNTEFTFFFSWERKDVYFFCYTTSR